MKKGQVYEGVVQTIQFPNKGIVTIDGEKAIVKNVIQGQKVKFRIHKARKGRYEGRVIEVLEKSSLETRAGNCKAFGMCGGCSYQSLSYNEQLHLKEKQVKELLDSVCSNYEFLGIKGSPVEWEYRNKMEFSFGDEMKDGPLALGMHKKGSFYDIITTDECKIVDNDYNLILTCVLNYCKENNLSFYKKMSHEGYLRHLLIRRAVKTGELLVSLVTSSQETPDLSLLVEQIKKLPLEGKLVGVLNVINDSLADVVQSDETKILYGQDFFYEELLGLRFKISTFSFFQTNSLGAEVLYDTAREFIVGRNLKEEKNTINHEAEEYTEKDANSIEGKVVFDLYSGTGTIAQILAPIAKKVIGVEIVEEAVIAARENAKLNGLHNCEFIAGDVLKVIDSIKEKPDFIVLDPPRDGIHPKALKKIIDYGVERIVYISCKPTSLVRDLEVLQEEGYQVVKACAVDMFPQTVHVETVIILHRKNI